jgi:hypothetical protein
MKRKMCLTVVCAVILLLVSTKNAPAQVVYDPYAYPYASYYAAPYYGYYPSTYVGGAYYRPYGGWYGRTGYVGGRYYGGPGTMAAPTADGTFTG